VKPRDNVSFGPTEHPEIRASLMSL
jgi:hypothetical protein